MEGTLEGFKDGGMDWKQIRKGKIGEIIFPFLNTKVKIDSGKLRMCIGGIREGKHVGRKLSTCGNLI